MSTAPLAVTRRLVSQGWIFVLLIAAATRWAALEAVPPGLKYDTASNGVYALNIVFNGARPFFINVAGTPEPLMVYLQSLAVLLFGAHVFTLRFVSAAAGILVVALVYALGRETTRDMRVALFAALALAVAVEPTHVTRTGLRATLVPLFETAWLLWFWRAWRTGQWRHFVAAGAVLGLGLYTYLATLALPLVAFALWLHQFVFARVQVRARLRATGGMVLTALLLALPRLAFQLNFPQAALQRAAQVSILQNPDVQTIGILGALAKRLLLEASLFGVAWQGELYNVLHRPLLDPFLFACFLAGLLVCFLRGKRLAYAWSLVTLAIMLLPDLLGGNEPTPNELRTIGVIPPAYFLAGVGAVAGLDWVARPRVLRAFVRTLILLLFGLSAVLGLKDYWVDYARAAVLGPDEDDNRTEIAQAQWIAQQREPVLLPLNEYARSPVHYLTGRRAPRLQSAFAGTSDFRMRPLPTGAWVLLPLDETRPRTEGKQYVSDPAAFVWIDDDRVSILPPARNDVAAVLTRGTATEEIRDELGHVVARAFWVDEPAALFDFQIPPARTALAQLSGGISLAAAYLDHSRVPPGGSVAISLFWRADHSIADDERIFVHLLDVHENVVAGVDSMPALGTYLTDLWRPGELVATHHMLKLPANAAPGRYVIEVGMYNSLDENRLDVLDADGRPVDSRVIAGTIKVDVSHATTYQPRHKGTADFGGAIRLEGWDAPPRAIPGSEVPVALYWQSLARVDDDYTVFVHLLDAHGDLVAQADHQPLDGQYPTSLWDANDQVRDGFSLAIPPETPPGEYDVMLGWYDGKTGQRLTLGNGQDHLLLSPPLEIQ